MEKIEGKSWSPYLAGALTGVVMILSVWIAGKYFGASTSFVRSAGMVEKIFTPERVGAMPYFMSKVPKIEWQWMFVFGILIGALVSSLTSRSFLVKAVPPMWEARFGTSLYLRGGMALLGGIVAMFGARLAGG